jgi:hypothetical protein
MMTRCKKQSKKHVAYVMALTVIGFIACTPVPASITPGVAEINGGETGASPSVVLTPELTTEETDAGNIADLSQGGADAEAVINPLTGLLIQHADRLGSRPILVKVTLYPRNNRPQWGLSQADIVFEHYTEGGLSRFSALYYGQEAEIVGPIRSARFVDIQLVRMYGAIFAYGSADYRVLEQIDDSEFAERAIREFPAGCPPLCRIDPTGQNHLVTDTQSLQAFYKGQGIDLTAPDLSGMSFDPSPPASVESGAELRVTYSADNFHGWTYMLDVGSYRRSQETGKGSDNVSSLLDRTTGEPIESANVVLLKVPHELYIHTPEIVDIQLYGQGEGLALRDGMAYDVRWIRPYPQGVLYLTFPDGSAYPLKPGTTWFELVGTTSKVLQEPEGRWVVSFDQP